MKKTEKIFSVLDYIVVIVLVVLLICRIFLLEDGEADHTIGTVNLIGMILAFLVTMRKVFTVFERKRVRRILGGIWLILLTVAVVFASYNFIMQNVFSDKFNDCITILALLFSLPAESYKSFFASIV